MQLPKNVHGYADGLVFAYIFWKGAGLLVLMAKRVLVLGYYPENRNNLTLARLTL